MKILNVNTSVNKYKDITYYISFHKISNGNIVLDTISTQILSMWEFTGIMENVFRYAFLSDHEVCFHDKEDAQKFMDEYLFPQMIVANLTKNYFSFQMEG